MAQDTKAGLDWQKSAKIWGDITQKMLENSALMTGEWVQKMQLHPMAAAISPTNLGESFLQAWVALAERPDVIFASQQKYHEALQGHLVELFTRATQGSDDFPSARAPDKRFKDMTWQESPWFDFVKQFYLSTSDVMINALKDIDSLDEKTKQKVQFYTRQYIDAVSPTNFAWSNPKVIRRTIETHGQNLLQGMDNFLSDIKEGKGHLLMKMANPDDFTLGESIAATPGKVIFRNALIELIQYEPTTPTVHETPILIAPPWINKYYIFDLRPHNSLVKWLTDQGYTTFIISWVNPDATLSDVSFDDYMTQGLFEAIQCVHRITGAKIHLSGYCIGGVLMACLLAWLGDDASKWIKSASSFASIIDYKNAGDLTVFIDEGQIKSLEEQMADKGYLEGSAMALSFNMLRANDLIWSFFIQNYLLADEPFPFDFLYWNSDSTRMPANMHSYYLRQLYLNNLLAKPGGITLAERPIDIATIAIPSFILAASDDHIAPWHCCYAATVYYKGPKTFVLAGSGHVAGIVNPPVAKKYNYMTNDDLPADPQAWLAGAKENHGSWWTQWHQWLDAFGDNMIPARTPKDALCEAPGTYVRVKSDIG